MCSRVTLRSPLDRLQAIFGFDDDLEHEARYNIAPTQPLLTLSARDLEVSSNSDSQSLGHAVPTPHSGMSQPRTQSPQTSEFQHPDTQTERETTPSLFGVHFRRQARWMNWGLTSFRHQAGEASRSQLIINARSETAHELPTFRDSFAHRRCVVLVDGFYEWRQEGRIKQPWLFELSFGEPFAMAALFQQQGFGKASCAILTTQANTVVSDIHHRMPVILAAEELTLWLNPQSSEDNLRESLTPFPSELMRKRRVSTKINDSRQDSADLLAPPEQASLF